MRDIACPVLVSRGADKPRERVLFAGGDLDGTATSAAIGFIVDVTDSRWHEIALQDADRFLGVERDRLARPSYEDSLTRIPNRRALDEEMARACLRVRRSNETLVVGMIDIDYFKRFNDCHGHLLADEIRCRVASALTSAARRSDFVARYGGEEFAFVLESVDDPEATVKRLLDAVAGLDMPHRKSPHGRITVS